MPSIEHEPWCMKHDTDSGGEVGACTIEHATFGPLEPSWPDGEPDFVGWVSAARHDEEDTRVYIEYRTTEIGVMNLSALRAVHEAVTEDPIEFLGALDMLIEELDGAVPPRRPTPTAEQVAEFKSRKR
jgi:hypothetical protein